MKGQAFIFTHRASIESLIEDETTKPELRIRLELLQSIRLFAEDALFLPLKKNYSTYVDLERPFVVWNVFAAPEFSMNPVNWCYPIAGCVSYRGYFAEKNAQNFARQFRENNNQDVYVGGVAAYSTLGWFSDSILNTVIDRDDYQLASLVFHELAHQVLYIPGETEFNESFATAVEQEGLQRWLQKAQIDERLRSIIVTQAELDRVRRKEFVELVTGTVSMLQQLYSSERSETEMRQEKDKIYLMLRNDYSQLKTHWGGFSGYDNWFAGDLNNAQLSTVATYNQWVPAFQAMLSEEQGSLQKFYARARQLEKLTSEQRSLTMESMLK